MGFLANRGTDPDRSWLDWRIVDWVLQARPRRVISHAA
jgi:hypothetical protein